MSEPLSPPLRASRLGGEAPPELPFVPSKKGKEKKIDRLREPHKTKEKQERETTALRTSIPHLQPHSFVCPG
jgi:hypothetical protein